MADHGGGGAPRTNLKWTSHMSNIMLRRLVDLIESGLRTEKGFKEVHVNTVARQVTKETGVEVSGNQVYNHLRKWRARWVKICKMRELSGALWDDTTNSIVLENEHYKGHIKDHPTDAEYLNKPLENYDQMAAIFCTGQATGRYAMGSNEPLGAPSDVIDSDEKAGPISNVISGGFSFAGGLAADVEDTNTNTPPSTWTPSNASAPEEVASGASEDKGKDSSTAVGSKRKRAMITEEEVVVFTGMTEAVKEMAGAIKATIHTEAHPDVYNAVITLPGFTEDVLLAALGWLYDNKAQSIGFVQMSDDHCRKWMNRWITKHYFSP
ncbi:uncharacterized protein LOC133910230 [Phragmites australis]|uniref:uncharacterized protein LOC133910230 n=1 Tax=Phragmites australis TaxID=29695 RepID=UPI002D770D38|nr:uncharacterized protein LOC133910230 [Phragmites australis]